MVTKWRYYSQVQLNYFQGLAFFFLLILDHSLTTIIWNMNKNKKLCVHLHTFLISHWNVCFSKNPPPFSSGGMWNSLSAHCFPFSYRIDLFKTKANRLLLSLWESSFMLTPLWLHVLSRVISIKKIFLI